MTKPQLVVFDFDWSFVGELEASARLRTHRGGLEQFTSGVPFADQDTDRYVFEVLAPDLRVLLRSRKSTMQWTDNVADCLRRLHAKGATRADIEAAFHTLPLHPAMKRGVTTLPSKKPTTFFLLSNSNSVFISTILSHHSLLSNPTELFTEIVTNPAEWRGDLLDLRRRIDPGGPQHECKVGCSPNMCKGDELDAFLARHGGREAFERIIYVGDGGNDFCPVARLQKGDFALVRTHRELARRIAKEGNMLKVEVKYWGGAWEVEQLLHSI